MRQLHKLLIYKNYYIYILYNMTSLLSMFGFKTTKKSSKRSAKRSTKRSAKKPKSNKRSKTKKATKKRAKKQKGG